MLDLRLRRGRTPSAAGLDTASGGGTTVRVGGVNQTGYLRAGSLTMRLGSFDFALVNPAVPPVIGNLVYVLEPAWDGQVVSVAQNDVPRGTDKIYKVVATNSKVAATAAAPFGLSDAPDNVTTFPYHNLSITTSTTDNGNTTRGTCTVYQQGLWPGMTFPLTSANFGLSAEQFTLSNVTVTWPVNSTAPVFALEFGDAVLGLTQLPINQGGITVDSSGVNLKDSFGTLIFNNGTGFGAAWRRFLLAGIYNGDFVGLPGNPDGDITANNPLPYWSTGFVGSAVTIRSVADSASGSGRILKFLMVPGAAGDTAYIEQIVPINSARGRNWIYTTRVTFLTDSAVNNMATFLNAQYLRNDGTPTGSGATFAPQTTTSIGANTVKDIGGVAEVAVPSDAYYLRVRVGFQRNTAANGDTGTIFLCEVRNLAGPDHIRFPDNTDPETYSYGRIYQDLGVMQLHPDSSGGTPFPILSLDGHSATPSATIRANNRLMFTPQGCVARRTTTQSITASTETAIIFNASEDFDPFGFHDLAANQSRFTVPTGWDGTYLLTCWAQFANNSATRNLLGWAKNGASQNYVRFTSGGVAIPTEMNCTFIQELVAGDYIEYFVYQNSGGPLNIDSAIGSIIYIGERV